MIGRRHRPRAASSLTALGWGCIALFLVMVGLIGLTAWQGYY